MSLFDPVARVLDRLAEAALPATLWWRDDDAGEPSAALDRLLALADTHGVPLALAVVPAATGDALAARLIRLPGVFVLQHGYAHQNHAGAGEKKIELGAQRPAQVVIGELATGRLRLESLFGEQALPVLVPPWNRLAPVLLPMLPELGYRGLSQFGPRPRAEPVAGLRQVNCHVDIIDWRSRAFIGADAAIAALARHLELRYAHRVTRPDAAAEPTGIMTHHAAHDVAAWTFLERLMQWLADGQTMRLLPATKVFAI